MVPFKHSGKVSLSKQNLLTRDRHECQYCGRALSVHNATVDHIVPVSRGGRRVWENVVAACKAGVRGGKYFGARPAAPARALVTGPEEGREFG